MGGWSGARDAREVFDARTSTADGGRSPGPPAVVAAYEATAARWIAPRLLPWDARGDGRVPVGAVVPFGFGAYVRVGHGDDRRATGGSLPPERAAGLVEVLRGHTNTPEDCRFAVWEGWGGLEAEVHWPGAVRLRHPGRSYVLLRGPIGAAAASFVAEPGYQGPNLWWPLDRAWCVATDVDLADTFVGADAACAADVRERLDAEEVSLTDPIVGDAAA